MSKRISSSKKGFTIIEILIVVTLMAFLATAAIGQSLNAQREFMFLDTFKQTLNKIREARIYAVTNFTIEDESGTGSIIPKYFGSWIKKDGIDYVIQSAAMLEDGTLSCMGNPYKVSGSNYEMDIVQIDKLGTDGEVKNELETCAGVTNDKCDGGTPPIGCNFFAFYEPPYADFFAKGVVPTYYAKDTDGKIKGSIVLKIQDKQKNNLTRYIVIFQGSGVAEGFYQPSAEEFAKKLQ